MSESSGNAGTLAAILLFVAASVWLGTLAQRIVERGSFLRGYFLGNRGLGAWALALTATVQSGGTFMGFPSLVYSHGWALALWIASYMVVPITGFAVVGKRMAHLSRRSGAITVPDLFRERFASPGLGLLSLTLVLFFMCFLMVAQFKAGAIVLKVAWPGSGALTLDETQQGQLDFYYYLGLSIFALTVVGYTVIGGFLAAVWTDLFQSVMMLVGVLLLLPLVLSAAGGLEHASQAAVEQTGPGFLLPTGYSADGRVFMPLGLAVSVFFVWVFAGVGSPAGIVRIMASKNTETIRKSVFLLAAYNMLIYLPLIVICVCGRAIIPNLQATDEIIPRLALHTTRHLNGGSLLAGLILTAPFGAVMATVSSFLVVIASGLVRDFYQRLIRPQASMQEIKRLTYAAMIGVGAVAFVANLNPVQYLQALVVFSGSGAASAFAVPAVMAAYWRRATAAGVMAAMLLGAGTVVVLYVIGFNLPDPMIGQSTRFRPYYLFGLEPIVWGLAASLSSGVIVSLLTAPPPADVVSRLFDRG
ncbi:MAG: sodium:solute symporter [Planctomycetia bacterium 21-64-5]|nr:MAG: sodium:solute symporter [Planctomycetia bacterium 21-64-5]HQU47014.1 sodium:solute symporter [Pirellulales bacterium]